MSDIRSFPYELLWNERSIRSVANLTRADGEQVFQRIASLRIEMRRTVYPLDRADEALDDLRAGRLTGTAVLDSWLASPSLGKTAAGASLRRQSVPQWLPHARLCGEASPSTANLGSEKRGS